MKSVAKTIILLAGILGAVAVSASQAIKVDPANAVIVLSHVKNKSIALAADELRSHLSLITDSKIKVVSKSDIQPGQYVFWIGFPAPGASQTMAPEEARWKVTSSGTYFYGDDSKYRNGTLYAVCDFLEKMFKVRWIEPDDIAFSKQNPLHLTLTSSAWKPELKLRNLRGSFGKMPLETKDKALKEFQLSSNAHNAFKADVMRWRNHMRMGCHDRPAYGHAFTEWWKKYGSSHPEYFALNSSGERAPVKKKTSNSSDNPVASRAKSAYNIKLCVSNPKVAKQIVKNWLAQKNKSEYINACVNDSPPKGFCRCPQCRKLDVTKKGEKFADHLTDRYVDFANRIVKEAKKYNPSAKVVIYAYNETEYPPRRITMDKDVVIGLVTTHFELDKINKLFSGWTAKGAKEIFFRPNQHHYYFTGAVPTGFEKHFYNVFQTAYKNNVIGFDYDCLINNWLVTGIADYILAKAMSDPSKSFDYWENHYLDAFGPAKPDVKKYFHYWRKNVWDKRLNPDLSEIVKKGRWYNFTRGLMWNLGKYYKESDFDKTDAYLKQALKHKLSPEEIARIKRLQVANKHARLVFKAVTTSPPEKFKYSLELLKFRQQHKNFKNVMWAKLFNYESYWGDITGIRAAVKFKDYSLPFIKTPHFWSFRLDPNNVGLKEGWYKQTSRKAWDNIATNHFWEKPYKKYKYPSTATRKQLANYDGIGWYSCQLKVPKNWKNRKVFLYFGAVDESCWVYVNGKLAGKHLFEQPNDWNSPFAINIDTTIDWNKSNQLVTVRVEDKSGAGGIWKPVWLVSQK
jgi:hypothetical protein